MTSAGSRLNSVVRIATGTRSVVAILRGEADHDGGATIAMDWYSRTRLGVRKNDEVEITIADTSILEKLRFYWNHPDLPGRWAARLAMVSLLLGVIAIIEPIRGLVGYLIEQAVTLIGHH
jgi:hypothetical protein